MNNMKNYKEIEFGLGARLIDCIEELHCYRDKGELVYGIFNGKELYSTDSEDEIYIKVTGYNLEDYNSYLNTHRENVQLEKEKHLRKIPSLCKKYMSKGRMYIEKEKISDWDKLVITSLHGMYRGFEIESSLDIFLLLKHSYSFDTIRDVIYNQGHSGSSLNIVLNIIKNFSPNGEDFYKFMEDKDGK